VHAKIAEQSRARELRLTGRSIRSIARELRVAQSSVSVWVRDVVPAGRPFRPLDAVATATLPRLVIWQSGKTRCCGRCDATLPLELFGQTRRGRQGWCRSCFRVYARERGTKHGTQVLRAKERRRARARAIVLRYLADHPCRDCVERDAVVLEFDHTRDKVGNVSKMIADGASPAALREELGKCDVVCVNCHRRRTATRAAWLRLSPTWQLELGAATSIKARNQLHVYKALVACGCIDCGSRDLVVLDFDHVGPKRGAVCQLAARGASIATLDAEIAHCEVRCANCHRRRTAERAGHYRSRGDLGIGHDGELAAIVVPPDRRERARELRAAGLTIAEIATEVGASVGTVGSWVSDIVWTEDERHAMHARRRTERNALAADAVPDGIRVCVKCGAEQPFTEYARRGHGFRRQCKSCDAARGRARTDEDRARAAAAQRERRRRARDAA